MTDLVSDQRAVCRRFDAAYVPTTAGEMLGVAAGVGTGLVPLHGLRHLPEREWATCGWYLWAGEELSVAPDFFQPLHVEHLTDRYPEVMPYLGLAPGWRFLIAPDYVDVWYDPSLLDVGRAVQPAI
jgi:hypothetical protein